LSVLTAVEVAVFLRAEHLVVTVHDDGQAAALPGHNTYGIVGMHERAVALGGSLTAGPSPDGGWLVRAELPVRRPQ
jgi:signal transduction histidine kinase